MKQKHFLLMQVVYYGKNVLNASINYAYMLIASLWVPYLVDVMTRCHAMTEA